MQENLFIPLFCSYFILNQNKMKLKETCEDNFREQNSERLLPPTGSFSEPEKITMILFSFVWLLFYTSIVTVAIERQGEAIVGQAGDLGHRGIPDPPTPTEVKKLGGEGETRKEQLKAILSERSGLISRCQMEVQTIQDGIWGKKRKAVCVNELIL